MVCCCEEKALPYVWGGRNDDYSWVAWAPVEILLSSEWNRRLSGPKNLEKNPSFWNNAFMSLSGLNEAKELLKLLPCRSSSSSSFPPLTSNSPSSFPNKQRANQFLSASIIQLASCLPSTSKSEAYNAGRLCLRSICYYHLRSCLARLLQPPLLLPHCCSTRVIRSPRITFVDASPLGGCSSPTVETTHRDR